MAATYDNENLKRIWPDILVPRDTIQKYANVHYKGNTKQALTAITGKFRAQDNVLLKELAADIDEKHEEHLVRVADQKLADAAAGITTGLTKEEKAAARQADKEEKAAAKTAIKDAKAAAVAAAKEEKAATAAAAKAAKAADSDDDRDAPKPGDDGDDDDDTDDAEDE